MESAFNQVALIFLVAIVVGMAAKFAKQPLIIAYIVVGILLGPSAFNVVSSGEEIALLAKMGIAILLFLVGLKLDTGLIRSTGKVALYTGVGQVVFTAGIGYLLIVLLGYDALPALYIAVALTFSSTIIIVKLLSDKRELDQLHGQIAVGFLIVQDILVIVAMVVIVAIGTPGSSSDPVNLFTILLGSVLFLVGAALLARFVVPRLLDWVAKSPELTLLFGVGWAVSLAAASSLLGLSMEIGAFVAGVTLASSPYRESMSGRMISLRDILLLFFFIQLGSSLEFADAAAQLWPALVLSVFVLVGNPIIVMIIMGVMGYRSKVSFKAGLAVAQISEFSLILIALGYSLGQVDKSVLSLVTLVGIITITLSTYLILYSDQIYNKMPRLLSIFERQDKAESVDEEAQAARYDVIIIGAGRLGGAIANGLRAKGATILMVDQNPDLLRGIRGKGVDTLFGDITDSEFSASLPLNEADSFICSVPERSANLVVLEMLQRYGYRGRITLTAMDANTAELFKENPAVSVVTPLLDAADDIVSQLPNLRDRG